MHGRAVLCLLCSCCSLRLQPCPLPSPPQCSGALPVRQPLLVGPGPVLSFPHWPPSPLVSTADGEGTQGGRYVWNACLVLRLLSSVLRWITELFYFIVIY